MIWQHWAFLPCLWDRWLFTSDQVAFFSITQLSPGASNLTAPGLARESAAVAVVAQVKRAFRAPGAVERT